MAFVVGATNSRFECLLKFELELIVFVIKTLLSTDGGPRHVGDVRDGRPLGQDAEAAAQGGRQGLPKLPQDSRLQGDLTISILILALTSVSRK